MDGELMSVVGVRVAEGRSGSTLLMQLLATADGMVFDDRYPAEYRWLSYFARTAGMMTEPFDESIHPGVTRFFFGPDRPWGPVPFESEVVDAVDLTGRLLRGMWAVWTDEVRRRHPDATMYAEKLAIDIEPLLAAGIPVRIIDLVRDPRDVVASIRSFASPGTEGFGRGSGQSEQAFLEQFITTYERGVARIAATPAGIERRLVRYEDLVTDLAGVSGQLGDWLGLELDHAIVERRRDRYQHHITSPSPHESVGRWRRDLDTDDANLIARRLGALMRPLGYHL